jgi:ribose transport system substrate-binding protein
MAAARRSMRFGLAAVLMAAALVGCSQDRPAGGKQAEVVLINSSVKAPFAVQMAEGFRYGAGQVAGVTARVAATDSVDPVEQMKLVEQEVRAGTTSLSMSTPSGETNDDPIGEAAEKGVHLAAVDSPPMPGSPVKLYIGNDNDNLGRLLADTVADQLGPTTTGKIVLGNPRNGLPVLDARAFGFRQQMRQRLPNVRVIGPLDTSDRSGAADSIWDGIAKSNADAVAFVSVGANAARLVKLRDKMHAKWLAGSFDVEAEALPAVRRGELVLVDPEHFLKGAVAGKLQAQRIGAETGLPEGWLPIPGLAVTRKNIDEISARDATAESRQAWYAGKLDTLLGSGSPTLRPLDSAQ